MKSIVLCGSRRFKPQIRELARKLKNKGIVVFEPFLNENRQIDSLPPDLKKYAFTGLTLHHLEFIRKADIVYIYNKGGYVGVSGTLEMGAAAALGKTIYAFDKETNDPSRDVLIDEVVSSVPELIKRLN